MSEPANESLEKEFELERMILFSDAVFAIAITLLILEIKFPELPRNLKSINIFETLKPTLIHFFAFVISFIFIGMSWYRHLTLFRFLRKYNRKVIFYNLLLLFFIVTFPFSISAFIDNINTAFFVAIFIYIFNILFVTTAQFMLTHYLLKKSTGLIIQNDEKEKQYFYLKTKYSFIMLLTTVVIMVAVTIISKGNPMFVGFSLYILPVTAIFVNKKLKKFKPQKINKLAAE